MATGDEKKTGIDDALNEIPKGLSKTFDAFRKVAAELKGDISNLFFGLDEKASEVVGVLGQSRNYAEGIRQSLADAVPELASIAKDGKDFEAALEAAANAQKEITKSLKTNLLLTSRQMIDIATVSQAYSISSQELGEFVERFATAGQSINNFPDALEKSANYARSMGVNVDATMEYISKNLERMNEFGFKDGVEGLGRMAARMAAMRIDVNAVYNFADKVFDPENAISMVAGFQKLGVAVGDLADPFRLMYLASEDVEELEKQIGKAVEKFSTFDEKSKSFKIAPSAKRDLRELSQMMGYNYEDLVKISQQAERLRIVGRDLNIGGVDEETKQFLANVAQYDEKKGGFAVKLNMEGETKLVSQINKDDIASIREANKELSPKEIARDSLTAVDSIRNDVRAIRASVLIPTAGSRTLSSLAEALRGGAAGAREGILERDGKTAAQRRADADAGMGGVTSSLEKFFKGTGDLSDVLSGIKKVLPDVTKVLTDTVKSIKDIPNTSGFKNEIMPDNNLKGLGESIKSGFDSSVDRLIDVLGIQSPAGGLAQNMTVNNNVTVQPVKVDVTGDINLKGANGEKIAMETNRELAKFVENIVKTELDKYSSQKTAMSAVPAMVRTA
jgi:ABC-type transporter Mla subunit MlaD